MSRRLLEQIGDSWRDAARDVVLIVASILIAFALDAWWGQNQERGREQRHLSVLAAEFTSARNDLRHDWMRVQKADTAASRLLAIVTSATVPPPGDTIARLFNDTYDVGVNPRDGGALLTLIASGDVSLIGDDTLAALLLGWPGLLQGLRSDGLLLTDNREQELRPTLTALGISEAAIASHLGWWDLPEEGPPLDATVLVGSRRLESGLVSRRVRLRLLSDQLEAAIVHVENILDRIAAADAE